MYKLTNSTSIIRADGATIPADPTNIDYAAYLAWVAAGNTPTPADQPTFAQQVSAYEAAVQKVLDDYAALMRYESILSMASYVNSTNSQFKSEATAAIAWRDTVWASCYATLAAVQAGTQAMPSSITVFLATLPAHS
jgi:hypothetical protein